MEKIDLFKQFKADYKPAKQPTLISTTPARYLSIEGQGEPGGEMFQASVGALYSMAFTIKMTRKAAGLGDYVICKLEALWWSDQGDDFAQLPPGQWQWQLIIRTPDCVTPLDLEGAVAAILKKGKAPGVDRVCMTDLDEGQCLQMIHIGPYEKEHETIAIMQRFMEDNTLVQCGKHHEIYLSDPRRVPPERLKTILRVPVR